MKICTNCVLPETFPGIGFNDEGMCTHCMKSGKKRAMNAGERKKYAEKFKGMIEKLAGPTESAGDNAYDVLMAYSGGKDSTYTMSLLKSKYDLRILAFSFDNGFISETSLSNIKTVTDRLGIDHVLFKPKWDILKKIFAFASGKELYAKKTLERASTICTSCIGLVKSLCLKTAIEKNIPMIGFGWSPGQAPLQSSIMKNNPSLIRMTQKALLDPMRKVAGNDIEAYFLNEAHYRMAEKFPFNVHPMAWEHYDEKMIMEEIKKLGWVEPEDTDTNSSNCLINAFANEVHIERYGFHPYVWEIANMVRAGIMERDEGMRKIYQEQKKELVDMARGKLNLG